MLASLLGLLVIAACQGPRTDLPDLDRQRMRAAAMAYADAWLSGDPDAVMATFTSEPVLSPSGLPVIVGAQAAREFWWPAGSSPTVVTTFEMTQEEDGGSGDIGFVRGTFTLAFDYAGASYENRGSFVSLLRRQPDGSWRITHHVWNDLPAGDG